MNGIISIELLALIFGILLLAYITKNQLGKWYRYSAIAIVTLVCGLLICTAVNVCCKYDGGCKGDKYKASKCFKSDADCHRSGYNDKCQKQSSCKKKCEKTACGADCTKPCCASKESCKPGCEKACCAKEKKSCEPGCEKACCAGEKDSNQKEPSGAAEKL